MSVGDLESGLGFVRLSFSEADLGPTSGPEIFFRVSPKYWNFRFEESGSRQAVYARTFLAGRSEVEKQHCVFALVFLV